MPEPTKPVIVYGASGYTGRLICEYLRDYHLPFVAAGRDKDKLQDAMSGHVAGIETADYEIAAVEHEVDALAELFAGASVVCNTVGPFSKLGPVVVEACLKAGVHYLDTTGEQDWLITCDEKYGADFAAAGLLLAPGVAQMYTTGEIAAQLCLEQPGLDTLDIAVFWGGSPTIASTMTILANAATSAAHYLEQNTYKEWDPELGLMTLVVPGQHELALALPWGGTSHPVWFKRDPRVANVRALGGVFNRALMLGVPQIVAAALEHATNTNTIGDNETPGTVGPVNVGVDPRVALGRSVISVAAGGEHTCVLLDDANVRCWGEAGAGQLGYGNTIDIGDTEIPGGFGPVDLGNGQAVTEITAGRAAHLRPARRRQRALLGPRELGTPRLRQLDHDRRQRGSGGRGRRGSRRRTIRGCGQRGRRPHLRRPRQRRRPLLGQRGVRPARVREHRQHRRQRDARLGRPRGSRFRSLGGGHLRRRSTHLRPSRQRRHALLGGELPRGASDLRGRRRRRRGRRNPGVRRSRRLRRRGRGDLGQQRGRPHLRPARRRDGAMLGRR